LLTNSNADYLAVDESGRDINTIVKEILPLYHPHYEKLIGSLPSVRIESQFTDEIGQVVTHYHNPDDDRMIKGVHENDNLNKIYQEVHTEEDKKDDQKMQKLYETNDEDINIESGKEVDKIIERVFGMKTALGLISTNWKFREEALKHALGE
jgi:hypothetical protein